MHDHDVDDNMHAPVLCRPTHFNEFATLEEADPGVDLVNNFE
jgi:hypothetical protein